MRTIFTFFVFILLISNLYAIDGGERIIRFHSQMNVNVDASAQVVENIKINATHDNIKRGIYRDIPVAKLGKIEVQSLYMDNESHPYFIENKSSYLRVNFGDDNYIATGEHTYKLVYNIEYAVQPFKNFDEVYWNVTGNNWIFPIEKASFELVLPEGANVIQDKISLYTGAVGSKENSAQKVPIADRLIFETTSPLYAGEGFTVAVPFQKGIVNVSLPFLYNQSLQTVLLIIIFVILLCYMYWAYNKVGKAPVDTIVTEFKPPQNISPAFMRYFTRKGFDAKTFAVALVNLAMKGYIVIRKEKGSKTIINKTQPNTAQAALSSEEENIMAFFGEETILGSSMAQEEKSMLSKRTREIAKEMKDINKQYHIRNTKYIIFPFVIFALAGVLWLWINGLLLDRFSTNILLLLFFSVFFQTAHNKRRIISISVFMIGLFAVLFFITIKQYVVHTNLMWFTYLLWLALYIFGAVIDNITDKGRALVAHIEGFKRYMKTAEKYRAQLSDPSDAEKIFCDYLPYAFALDMENDWMRSFEGVLSAATMERNLAVVGGIAAVRSGSFISGLNSSLSSSGAGGGGSSGGGRGGGGGGGR